VAKYSIRIKKTARKELESIGTKPDRQKIIKRILSLADNPFPVGSMKLSGRDRYRLRQGNYRILYAVEDRVLVVQVIKIGHRKNVCR